MTVLSRRQFVLASVSMASGATVARATEYPTRPITVIIPYAAGGAGDTIIRLLQPAMERNLGQPLVIDSRAGSGGTIGAQAVAMASPDGYTLLLGATNNFVINQFLFPKVSFDPLAAFALVTKVADVPSVLYASMSAPTTLAAFIASAKTSPGKFSYASPSVGTTPHLAVERLKQMTGIDLVHIPYRGAPQAMQALMANEVQLYLAGWGVGRNQVQAGKVRALAVASEQRVPNIPLPTVGESGVPGYIAANWWGLAAPKGTPQPVLERIHRSVVAALAEKSVQDRLDTMGFLPGGNPSQKFLDEARAEAKTWEETIARGKLAID